MTTKPMLVALMLTATAANAAAAPLWATQDTTAYTEFASGVIVAVGFPPAGACDYALFIVAGNPDIEEISFRIDGASFRSTPADPLDYDGVPAVTFILSDIALAMLKSGSHLDMLTDEGQLSVSLAGSAAAIDTAWGACEQTVSERAMQLEPKPEPVPATYTRSLLKRSI